MKTPIILIVGILTALVITSAVIALPWRAQNNDAAQTRMQGSEHRAEVEAAIEAGDYEAWVSAMGDCPRSQEMTKAITSENFPTFIKMHEALQNGDLTSAQTLREELGLPVRGFHRGMRNARQ